MTEKSANASLLSLLGFMLIVFAVAGIGYFFQPGDWYAALWKPAWTPPNWLFGPVWTLLYIFIAIAGWRIFSLSANQTAKKLWIAQLVLNGLWSPVFFGLHSPVLGLAVILPLLASIAVLIILSYGRQALVFFLMLPYLLWVAYAASLNAAIVWGN